MRVLKNGLVCMLFIVLMMGCKTETPKFDIALAQWSLHRSFTNERLSVQKDWGWYERTLQTHPDSVVYNAKYNPKDFPKIAADMGFNTIELVNVFYFGKVTDFEYWDAFKEQCKTENVSVGLIMCDHLGDLGNPSLIDQELAIQKHKAWVDVAAYIGAHSVRVNASGIGNREMLAGNVINGIKKLGLYAAQKNIKIVIENHRGYSSDAKWLTNVVKEINLENVGLLTDFGNFCMDREYFNDGCHETYDTYLGIEEMLPYSFGLSAKAKDFDAKGNETNTDYYKIFELIKKAGVSGTIGIEYEGDELSEEEGIIATKKLLEKILTTK